MEDTIDCFVNQTLQASTATYNYYIFELRDSWNTCQLRILAKRIDNQRDEVVDMIRKRLITRISLTDDSILIDQMRNVVKVAKMSNSPVNIENELQQLLPIEADDEAVDLMWNKAGVIINQFDRLLKEYQSYVETKLNKIERIWSTTGKIAVDTIMKTLIYISYLDCGSVNPLYYAKRWRVNYKNVNLSDEIWRSIYPIFEDKSDIDILNYLNGIINGIIFINIPTEECSSNAIHLQLEQLTQMKEVFFNLDYIRLLHAELLDYDYTKYNQRGRPRVELLELRDQHGYDLLLNVTMIGFYLILHDCHYIPYNIVDNYQSLSYQPSIIIDWSSYLGEIYHIMNLFFSTTSSSGIIHNGSNFTNLFGLGYNEFLTLIHDRATDIAIDRLVIWYTLYVLNNLKSIR